MKKPALSGLVRTALAHAPAAVVAAVASSCHADRWQCRCI